MGEQSQGSELCKTNRRASKPSTYVSILDCSDPACAELEFDADRRELLASFCQSSLKCLSMASSASFSFSMANILSTICESVLIIGAVQNNNYIITRSEKTIIAAAGAGRQSHYPLFCHTVENIQHLTILCIGDGIVSACKI